MSKVNNKDIILITGSAGFVGFHATYFYLSQGYKILGIDALNQYYDVNLKLKRNEILSSFENYIFFKESLENKESLKKIVYKYKPTIVLHLAAQAGVRYSIENPSAYINSNVLGTYNLLEVIKNMKLKHFLFASTSSIYGNSKSMPLKETQNTDNQISFYASTKKANESMLHYYSYIFKIPVTIFRFFTVYGPWGRPDMAYFSFTKKIIEGRKIEVFNHGNMQRDFTYIDDIVDGIRNTIDKDFNFEIFNLGNSKSEDLMTMIRIIEKELNINAKIVFKDMQAGDVFKTYADIKKSSKMLEFKPKVSLQVGLKRTIDWYKSFIGLK